jgi:CRISPR-associated protein Cas5d
MKSSTHTLKVWGELACFSRPEMKVERFSYPVITPSAARGIFDAIYGKPVEFRWQVERAEVLSPPSYIALRRNEVKEKVSVSLVAQWMRGKSPPEPILADSDGDATGRTQRQTMALRDVHYRLHARIVPWPGFEPMQSAFDEQFRRRASKGKCFYHPFLGCREFPAWFELCEPGAAEPPPIGLDLDIGLMLYDIFNLSRPGHSTDRPYITLFRARVEKGVLEVPCFDDPAVIKPPGGAA